MKSLEVLLEKLKAPDYRVRRNHPEVVQNDDLRSRIDALLSCKSIDHGHEIV